MIWCRLRCQLHRTGTRVALYSRDLRETTAAFPEVAEAAAEIAHDLLIDGEILAHRDGNVLRFFELQRRLGRKVVAKQLREEVPVVLVAFDLLHLDGRPLLDLPLRERRRPRARGRARGPRNCDQQAKRHCDDRRRPEPRRRIHGVPP